MSPSNPRQRHSWSESGGVRGWVCAVRIAPASLANVRQPSASACSGMVGVVEVVGGGEKGGAAERFVAGQADRHQIQPGMRQPDPPIGGDLNDQTATLTGSSASPVRTTEVPVRCGAASSTSSSWSNAAVRRPRR